MNTAMVTRTPMHRWHARLALLATALALVVIVFGAFVRLSNAGLSCPDWPTCYGRATWPVHAPDIAAANDAFPERPVESHKAWREQVHRHLAAILGALVLALALLRHWPARSRRFAVIGAVIAVIVAIGLYMRGMYTAASALALAGELVLLGVAARRGSDGLARLSALTLAVVIFQALLGMWTVTWLLKPVVVMGHLLGGLATFALLLWAALRAHGVADRDVPAGEAVLRDVAAPQETVARGVGEHKTAEREGAAPARLLIVVGLVVLAIQIALGGWTSANYAALACGMDFPTCQGTWLPATDFHGAFVLWRGIGVDYEGGVLDGPARVAIQLTHRGFAVIVLAVLGLLAIQAWRARGWRAVGIAIAAVLALQAALGVLNVMLGLPLLAATAHNAGAVLLLALLVAALARRTPPMAA